MIDLGRHIEVLLLTNDCVIVPSLGGFVAHHVDARYDDSDGSLLPPYRTLGFNPQLSINDSLLAQSYIEAFDISYPEAIRMIEDEVNELKQELNNTGRYMLEGIGKLSLNTEGNINFEPYEAGVLTPSLYGLSSVLMPLIARQDDSDAAQQKAGIPSIASTDSADDSPIFSTTLFDQGKEEPGNAETEEKEEKAISIKLSWVRNAVAIAAAITAFFVLSTPISNSGRRQQVASHLHGTELLTKLIPQDANAPEVRLSAQRQPEAAATASAAASQASAKESTAGPKTASAKDTPEDTAAAAQTGKYCIVLASQIPVKNAEIMAEQLRMQGLDDCRVASNGRMTRVVCGSFATEAEAYKRLVEIRTTKNRQDAWIYRIN